MWDSFTDNIIDTSQTRWFCAKTTYIQAKQKISMGKVTEMRKLWSSIVCSRSFLSPSWKNDSDYMDFQPVCQGWKS